MPRKRTFRAKSKDLISVLFVLGLLWLLAHVLQDLNQGWDSVTVRVIIAIIVVAATSLLLRVFLSHAARQDILRQTSAIVGQNLPPLIRRRSQLAQKDAYGQLRLDKWEKEIDYFISHQLVPTLTRRLQRALTRNYPAVANAIEKHVETAAQLQPPFQTFSDHMTPSEFEAFCAEELRQAGWDARVTVQSGDQGADVVAEKKGLRVVLQCKLYSRPVGNKAVQEVAAARAYERAHYGVVVSNNTYTRAAEQLASTNKVVLVHYRELWNLDNILSSSR